MRVLAVLASLFLALAGCSVPRDAPPYRTITMQAQIEIHRPVETVFAFVTDPANEMLWRAEVQSFSASGTAAPGIVYREVIRLGLRSEFSMAAAVTAFDPPDLLRVEAVAEQDRFFTSERVFTRLNNDWTRVTYRADADERVVYDVTRVPLGLDAAAAYYEWVMLENLKRLKHLLEAANG